MTDWMSLDVGRTATPLNGRAQTGPLASGFEHGLALCGIDPFADEDRGDGSSGTRKGSHNPVCSILFGVQTSSRWSACGPE